MLKFKLNSESFEKLGEVEKTFYTKLGDDYQLQVDGAVDKSKLDEFRSTNVNLLKQQEQFKDVDVEKYRKLEEQERKIRDKELIDKGEFDTLLAENTATMRSDLEAKLTAITEKFNESTNRYNGLVTKTKIEDAVSAAVTDFSIRPKLTKAVMLLVKDKFIVDNGQVIAKDGDKILTGADGNLTVSEFVGSLGEDYKIPSTGGKGDGNNGSDYAAQTTARRDAYSKLLS